MKTSAAMVGIVSGLEQVLFPA